MIKDNPTDEAVSYGCGCLFAIMILVVMTLIGVFTSCRATQGGYYAGQIERINYIYTYGHRSMFLHTDKYIILTNYSRRPEVGDSLFILEEPPRSFYRSYNWAIVNSHKIPMR